MPSTITPGQQTAVGTEHTKFSRHPFSSFGSATSLRGKYDLAVNVKLVQSTRTLYVQFTQQTLQNTLGTGVYVFFYLIEQHSKFLLHTLQVLYMCTLFDSTNINTIIDIHEMRSQKTPSHCRSQPS